MGLKCHWSYSPWSCRSKESVVPWVLPYIGPLLIDALIRDILSLGDQWSTRTSLRGEKWVPLLLLCTMVLRMTGPMIMHKA